MTMIARASTARSMIRLKIYFDGGCRPNPGKIETAVVARGETYYRPDCGLGTNNDAEWLALVHAADIARAIGLRNILFLGDSALVVGQASGILKCRNASLQSYLDSFNSIKSAFDSFGIRRIGRHQNLAGIALEKRRL